MTYILNLYWPIETKIAVYSYIVTYRPHVLIYTKSIREFLMSNGTLTLVFNITNIGYYYYNTTYYLLVVSFVKMVTFHMNASNN